MTSAGGYSRSSVRLTPAMRNALDGLSRGQTPKQIAAAHGITVGTVYAELSVARQRLGARTNPQACVMFAQDGSR